MNIILDKTKHYAKSETQIILNKKKQLIMIRTIEYILYKKQKHKTFREELYNYTKLIEIK